MGSFLDFIELIETDVSVKILKCLDDPADIVRVSCVSQSWRQFVVAHGLTKQLCLKMFPQLSRISSIVELDKIEAKAQLEVGSSCRRGWEALKTDHRVFAYLAWACKPAGVVGCISEAISASSTDNYPLESIENTLEPRDIVARRAMYWSSKGESNPAVPETLIYKLSSELCIVSEINIRPFEAFFQTGAPIYAAKAVQFRLGHPKSSDFIVDHLEKASHDPNDDNFVWTYTSPEYPMAQKITCRTSSFQNLCFALAVYYRLNYWGGFRDKKWMGYSIYASHMLKFWAAHCHLLSVSKFWNLLEAVC